MIAATLKLAELYRARTNKLAEIKSLLEIANLLPETSEARRAATQDAESQLIGLLRDETTKRRDPTGFVLAIVFLLGGAWAGIAAFTGSGWWLGILAFVLLALGATGLSQDAVRRERDAKGRPIRR